MATKNKKAKPGPVGHEIFCDEEPVDEGSTKRVLTVNGKPVPEEVAHLIPYGATDQGIKERAEANRYPPTPGVEVTNDAWDKQIDRRADATEAWESPDPMKDIVDTVRQPGMSYRYLSPGHIAKKGMRKFIPVIRDGDPVKLGNMILGQMPTETRNRRMRYYEDKGNRDLAESKNNLRDDVERLSRDGAQGVSGLNEGDSIRDSATGQTASIGITRARGALSE